MFLTSIGIKIKSMFNSMWANNIRLSDIEA